MANVHQEDYTTRLLSNINDIITLVAESITRFVMKRIPVKRIKEVNVIVNLRDTQRLLFEIDVEVKTDALVKQEVIDKTVNEAIEYGFKLLDKVIEYVKTHEDFNIEQLKKLVRRVERECTSPKS